jgi:hypothetical protein
VTTVLRESIPLRHHRALPRYHRLHPRLHRPHRHRHRHHHLRPSLLGDQSHLRHHLPSLAATTRAASLPMECVLARSNTHWILSPRAHSWASCCPSLPSVLTYCSPSLSSCTASCRTVTTAEAAPSILSAGVVPIALTVAWRPRRRLAFPPAPSQSSSFSSSTSLAP